MAEAGRPDSNPDAAAGWEALAREEAEEPPIVDSPSIAGDWPATADDQEANDWQAMARHDAQGARQRRPLGLLGRLRPGSVCRPPAPPWARWRWR